MAAVTALYEEWVADRTLASFGTNHGARQLAFQTWHRFKEAFSPELVRRALTSSASGDVGWCLDPFGGSGTTALTAQLLGISSTTIEVNPFLVDVISAKLSTHDADALVRSFRKARTLANRRPDDVDALSSRLPATFVEPGVAGRWLFDKAVASRIASLLAAIDEEENEAHRRFLRVVLGGALIDVSNVVVSGKGRRYRRDWRGRRRSASDVDAAFYERVERAITDVHRFAARPRIKTEVMQADARRMKLRRTYDAAIFSPPYPNSFDYTDVYNVELWMLGYLNSATDNRALRESTITSHVQILRSFRKPPASLLLAHTVDELSERRDALWSRWLPDMVGGYFADLCDVLARVHAKLRPGGLCWIVLGDSRYGGVFVPTADIVTELALQTGWSIEVTEACRSMRSSPQHGGRQELPETLLVLRKKS